jgi:hypothetical protein
MRVRSARVDGRWDTYRQSRLRAEARTARRDAAAQVVDMAEVDTPDAPAGPCCAWCTGDCYYGQVC